MNMISLKLDVAAFKKENEEDASEVSFVGY